MTEVRPASPHEFAVLREIEIAADEVFRTVGMTSLPTAATIEEIAAADAVLVTGNPPCGFARIEMHGDVAHLDQLSVRPTDMRAGVGGRLLEAAVEWARERGCPAITLATFRDIAWNAPFYATHGFRVVPADTPALRAVERHEQELGLTALGARVLMARDLTPG